jgi:hypothetical protein
MPMQCSLAETAALAPAWQVLPESAPLHGLALHVVAPPDDRFRGRVISELAKRLGAKLATVRGCSVCVLCQVPGRKMSQARGGSKGEKCDGERRRPSCQRGTVYVTDAWVVHALQTASRPGFDDFLVS